MFQTIAMEVMPVATHKQGGQQRLTIARWVSLRCASAARYHNV